MTVEHLYIVEKQEHVMHMREHGMIATLFDDINYGDDFTDYDLFVPYNEDKTGQEHRAKVIKHFNKLGRVVIPVPIPAGASVHRLTGKQ